MKGMKGGKRGGNGELEGGELAREEGDDKEEEERTR